MACFVVIPCYNEAERLDRDMFRAYLKDHPDTAFVFVNDGSTDRTGSLLQELKNELPGQVEVLEQQPNAGKAEAVRVGLRHALGRPGGAYAGFWDADLATPLAAIDDLLSVFSDYPEVEIVFGARVKLLGRRIERQPVRHYLGRVFATCASIILKLPVYDTQCGAKLFRVTPELAQVLEQPFYSRWIFDVEVIARFLQIYKSQNRNVHSLFYEFPLYCWKDIAGSKLRASDFLRAVKDLLIIRGRYITKRAEISVIPDSEMASRRNTRRHSAHQQMPS